MPTETWDFEAGVMPAAFEADGDAAWTVDSADANSGTYSARSGVIADGATSVLRRRVVIGASGGLVFFTWKVGCESGWDFLRFKVDGVTVASITGSTSWATQMAVLAAGERVLEWSYEKDPIITVAPDEARVDDIVIDGIGWADVSAEALVVELDTTGGQVAAEALVVELDTTGGQVASEALVVELDARNVGRCAGLAVVVEVDALDPRPDLAVWAASLDALIAGVRALDAQVAGLLPDSDVTALGARCTALHADLRVLRTSLDGADVLHARRHLDPAQAVRLWRWERATRRALLSLEDRLHAVAEVLRLLVLGGAGESYAARAGDTLQGIAARELGDWRRWRELLTGEVGAGPLTPGQIVRLPRGR